MRGIVQTLLMRVAWLLVATVLAFGSAGIVAGMEHQPGTPAREELTWAADEAIRPGLEAAAGDLRGLSASVDGLGELGRSALAALVSSDTVALSAAIDDGKDQLKTVAAQTEALRDRLRGLPGAGEGAAGRLGAAVLTRYDTILVALQATSGLAESWSTLTSGSVAATKLSALLTEHDKFTAAAALDGSRAEYDDALKQLDSADATLAQASALRDALANSVDVTVLSEWLKRNADEDSALRRLYAAFKKSRGLATKEVHDALKAELAAEANLPPDTRGLVVIMAEVARGGLNQAVITIEEARGRLSAAVDAVSQPINPDATPAP